MAPSQELEDLITSLEELEYLTWLCVDVEVQHYQEAAGLVWFTYQSKLVPESKKLLLNSRSKKFPKFATTRIEQVLQTL